jgi:pimeloyl-ACP methyl ester carboxylesterase
MSLTCTFKAVEFAVNGHNISAISNVNHDKPVLLCLHGWLDNAASFQPLIPYLSNYHVIAIDWPGHGLSSHRSVDAHYHFLDWVYDLISLFRSQQWQSIDVVGHSMGGMVATAFASAFPEHVKTLTLIDSIGFLSADAPATASQLRKGLLSRLTQQTKAKKFHANFASAVDARVVVSDLSHENAALIVQRGIEQTAEGFMWRSDSRLRAISPYRYTMAQAQALISAITAPVQLLYGDKGMDMVIAGVKNFGSLFNSLTVHKLVGGHHVHMEQAEHVSNLINQFIKSSD